MKRFRMAVCAAFVLAFALSLAAQSVQSTPVPGTVTTTVQPDNPGCKITIFNGTDKTIVGWGLDVSVTHTDGKSYGRFRLVHDNNFAYAYPFDPEETKALRDNYCSQAHRRRSSTAIQRPCLVPLTSTLWCMKIAPQTVTSVL